MRSLIEIFYNDLFLSYETRFFSLILLSAIIDYFKIVKIDVELFAH